MFVFLFPFQSMVEKSRGNLTYLREKVYCILCYGLVLMHTVTGCNETVHCTHLVLKCIYYTSSANIRIPPVVYT